MEFITIIEYPEYEINESGIIKNKKTGRIMKQSLTAKGYYTVNLTRRNSGRSIRLKVHRLIAITFIPNLENKKTVDHINRIRTDNRIENLRWASINENNNNKSGYNNNKINLSFNGVEWKLNIKGDISYNKNLDMAYLKLRTYLEK